MSEPTALQARLVEVEIRYSHLEKLVDELNEVIVVQQKAIDRLNAEVSRLGQRMLSLDAQPDFEKPPHY